MGSSRGPVSLPRSTKRMRSSSGRFFSNASVTHRDRSGDRPESSKAWTRSSWLGTSVAHPVKDSAARHRPAPTISLLTQRPRPNISATLPATSSGASVASTVPVQSVVLREICQAVAVAVDC